MTECLTYAFHKRLYAPPCGRCSACLAVAPIVPPGALPPPGDGAGPETGDVAPDGPAVDAVPTGGGWYEIVADGEVLDRVRGKEAADTRAAELAGGAA